MKVRVEYEAAPIRHVAVQCPKCKRWFYGRDIVKGSKFRGLMYEADIMFSEFHCPICNNDFGYINAYTKDRVYIEKVSSAEECYNGCLEKKEVWE